jgi:hypothetical protein
MQTLVKLSGLSPRGILQPALRFQNLMVLLVSGAEGVSAIQMQLQLIWHLVAAPLAAPQVRDRQREPGGQMRKTRRRNLCPVRQAMPRYRIDVSLP